MQTCTAATGPPWQKTLCGGQWPGISLQPAAKSELPVTTRHWRLCALKARNGAGIGPAGLVTANVVTFKQVTALCGYRIATHPTSWLRQRLSSTVRSPISVNAKASVRATGLGCSTGQMGPEANDVEERCRRAAPVPGRAKWSCSRWGASPLPLRASLAIRSGTRTALAIELHL
jgi:hypothetical protein